MRLARLGPAGAERPAVVADDGSYLDLSGITGDIDGAFLAGDGVERARAALGGLPRLDVPAGTRIGPPVAGIGKVVCIGQNYAKHARESGAEPPTEPIIFLKAADTVVGPDDDVRIPKDSVKTDWEVELAIVIGRRARYLENPGQANDCIAGYAVSNDVSERAFQLERLGQWDKGKNCETFNPLGPWLVTPDSVDVPALRLRSWVNGEARQDEVAADMIFGVEHLVWYVSQFMVLHPGDVINTGTPAGVALGLPGQPYLRAGDVMEMEIAGLGRQRQTLTAHTVE
ncbi:MULTISPECIES: fumarylacetoacetate hydrolase family protein [Dactylosporangium]|uniref:2-hydroxyhepta-2,4-diene-1,7-dioate isomerase n=2 Tax=Dactylosporangium TaxID=35753 RepID=A0A9W6KQX0_9ACTN|nr:MULTISPECIES: fumarylacetoacetate hydrolase family protein [Dactylosporangium]UAB99426.1 fumarylacetoacetate hydrolase family protein [Dactylosporangium vinaceum]UWZ47652.1 fumarylacetoacetate hydrolase family protein [Dactylosporangium matsuzakiense]GLL05602.1 2-hydroxyhepta-2,4-diene-1,7-dioate isomerase [Dactylosporangium matsuzakiense]